MMVMQVTVAHPDGIKLNKFIDMLAERYEVSMGQGVAVDGIPIGTIVITNKTGTVTNKTGTELS